MVSPNRHTTSIFKALGIAREAAGKNTFVAGAIGPLGIRIEPWGKMSIAEARDIFREQAQALLDGNVDLFILETFFDLNEVQAAMQAVRGITDRPLIVQMSVEDDSNSLEGTPPEVFARQLADWGADVIGLNCSVGPHTMLDAIQRIAGVTKKSLSVQPNAGKPRNIEGRNIYLCSPEYMASYARKFVQYGVRIVGGCCGTTPQHIRAIRTAVQGGPLTRLPGSKSVQSVQSVANPLPPLATQSKLATKLGSRQFVKVVEMIPPMGHDFTEAVDRAKYLQSHDIDAVNVPDASHPVRKSAPSPWQSSSKSPRPSKAWRTTRAAIRIFSACRPTC